jgi:hypothetical protein
MWTFKKPYHSEELTKSYIEERGRLALSRALSIGRVVGFVASGATVGYGQKDWNTLVKETIEDVTSKADDKRTLNGAAKTALSRLKNDPNPTRDPTHMLGLAERLAEEIGEEESFREKIGEGFSETRNEDPLPKSKIKRRSEPLRRLIVDLRLNRLLTLNYDCQIEEEFHRLYRTSKWDRHPAKQNTNDADSDFETLRSGNFGEASKLHPRVEHSDGTARSVLSMSMNSGNIGELVNFALQPLQFSGQVFHLHGRFDQPRDIVLTDRDYRRTYLRSDEQAQTFDEALSALMSGNDILFVGVGMSEADLLRPLRQFVSRDKSPETFKRHVFAMLEHSVSLDMDWLHEATENTVEGLANAEKEFRDRHIKRAKSSQDHPQGAAIRDFSEDERRAVMFRTEYGVYSIFHGNQFLRSIQLAIKLLVASKKPKLRSEKPETDQQEAKWGPSPLERKICPHRYLAAMRAMRKELASLLTDCPYVILDEIPKSLLQKDELQILLDAVSQSHEKLCEMSKSCEADKFALNQLNDSENLEQKLKEIASEARSRALDRALKGYAQGKDRWWADWRQKPKSRHAEFRQVYAPSDKQERRFPSAARHRPIYEPIPEGVTGFAMIDALAKLTRAAADDALQSIQTAGKKGKKTTKNTQKDANKTEHDTNEMTGRESWRDYTKVPPKRVIRASLPRGHGKGALLHILQQPVGKAPDLAADRLFLDTLLDKVEVTSGREVNELENDRYFGTFFLHLSFSMEFASVISALKSFVEQATCGLLVENSNAFLLKRARLRQREADPSTFLAFLDGLTNGPGTEAFRQRLKSYKDFKGNDKRPEVEDLVKIFTDGFWGEQKLQKGIGRVHRLEELRSRMSAYTDVVNVLKDKNLRLGIVMSGLDKLCDGDGVAFNPMFRALFRLLSGCGTKYKSESDATTPIDLFLFSGAKDVPLRYLSSERTRQDLEQDLSRPKVADTTDPYSSYAEYRPINEGRFLAVWPSLPRLDLEERFWLDKDADRDLKTLLRGEREDLQRLLGSDDHPERREIRRLCENGVAVHSWVAGAFRVGQEHISEETERRRFRSEFLDRMDAAAARGETSQVLREVLEYHKPALRRWGAALHADLDQFTTADKLTEFRDWPPKTLRQGTGINIRASRDPKANHMVDLVYLILSHLALFPMPVESRVLYSCDEIYRLLTKICAVPSEVLENSKDEARDIKRQVRLRLLSQILSYLKSHNLLIAVLAKPSVAGDETDMDQPVGATERTLGDIHTRYTIHHQLRDFTARLMDLSLPDQGERNFFQVSIYCDQPRDLPAPREDHYELVRQIMQRQIELTRNSIWTMMQLTKTGRVDTLDVNDRALFDQGLRRRFMNLAQSNQELDAQMPSIHAIPQRIRALYGLLRSGFSIGTISRLTALDEKELDQPYERFKGWLRGVTNAATGWDHVLDTLFYDASAPSPETATKLNTQKTRRTFATIAKHIDTGSTDTPHVPDELASFAGLSRPLYRDEIGWLLNERGVVSLVQGQIFDAIPLFQRALEEMHHDDMNGQYDPALHAAVRRVRLNMATALIDRGHLNRATAMLKQLQLPKDFSSHSGSQISWLAQGYIGLVQHLRGNLQLAGESYDATIKRAQDREMMRVVGIFAKHKADLLRRAGDYNAARSSIDLAISAALNCAQRDILHLAKVSQGHIEVADPKGDKAMAGICTMEALQFAQSMGIPRLESEAKCLQAAMMLTQNERMLAGTAATEAAAIANRNGLRLHKLLALKHYGSSLRQRGQKILARQVVAETRREAERRGYQSLALGLAEELRQLA